MSNALKYYIYTTTSTGVTLYYMEPEEIFWEFIIENTYTNNIKEAKLFDTYDECIEAQKTLLDQDTLIGTTENFL